MGEFEKQGQIPYPERNEVIWRSETQLRDYLYRISVLGKQGVIPILEFPAMIDLDSNWHGVIDHMREESRDGLERSTVFGFQSGDSRFHAPMEFITGTRWEAGNLDLKGIKKEHDLDRIGGTIHSHPKGRLETMMVRAYQLTKLAKSVEGFSPADLYEFIGGTEFQMEGVVAIDHTYFAFRTTETNAFLNESTLPSLSEFEKYWYRQIGIYLLVENHAIALSVPLDFEKMNVGIADTYGLVLYRGKQREYLVRIHPKRQSS